MAKFDTTGIRSIIAEVEQIKAKLKSDLDFVSKQSQYSDDYKLTWRAKLTEEAGAKLKDIAARVDDSMPDFMALNAEINSFDYTDARLSAALSLIKTAGKSLPENAWKKMISDFSGKPAILLYLADVMDSNGVVDGAVNAKEAAQEFAYSAGLPQRIADRVYYIASQNPQNDIDTSGLWRDIDGLDTMAASLTSESDGGQAAPADGAGQ